MTTKDFYHVASGSIDTEGLRRVAVWGASLTGEACCQVLRANNIEIAWFLDRNVPADGLFMGCPVYNSACISDGTFDTDVDCLILAIGSDTTVPRQMLRDAAFPRPVIQFVHNTSLKLMFQNQFCINRLLRYDRGKQDRLLLQRLQPAFTSSPVTIYGAGRLIRYLFQMLPALTEHVVEILDDDPHKQGSTLHGIPIVGSLTGHTGPIFLASTRYRSLSQMHRTLGNRTWFGLGRAIEGLSIRDLPAKAWLDQPPGIYPVTIPPIRFEDNLDFVLLDLPPRFMGMMPNGLGFVHNILKRSGIRFQTMDLDLIYYHRFHAQRLLDGEVIVQKDDPDMVEDPWEMDRLEEEWRKPEMLDYFARDTNELVEELIRARPKMIGVSLHNSNITLSREVIQRVKQGHPELIVVAGGYDCVFPEVGPYVFPEYDYMIIFEAEASLPPLLEKITQGERPGNLPGILSKYDTPDWSYQPARAEHNLDLFDFPKYDWVDFNLYRNYNGSIVTPVILSRGCAWSRCTFCSERFLFRKRSAEGMVDEIEWLVKQGSYSFVFGDSDLSGDTRLVRAVCEEIIRRKLKVSLSGQLRIQKGYSKEYFDVLYEAGFKALRYGVDAWSRNTLKLQKKGYTIPMIEDVLGYTSEAGIEVAVNLVIGIPHETEADIDETIANIIKNKAHVAWIANLNTLIMAYGNLYWENPEKHGIVFKGDQEELARRFIRVIPTEYWYSVDPYIDQDVRLQRLVRIIEACRAEGVGLGAYAAWTVKQLTSSAT